MGYPFYAVMSAGNTRERAQMMRALGAEVVIVDQLPDSTPGQVNGGDMRRVKQRAAELVAEKSAYFVDQFENEANPAAHEKATSAELWEQCGASWMRSWRSLAAAARSAVWPGVYGHGSATCACTSSNRRARRRSPAAAAATLATRFKAAGTDGKSYRSWPA
jgi:hypothetical protein